MPRRTKQDILKAAKSALSISEEMLVVAQSFRIQADDLNELITRSPTRSDNTQLIHTRNWAIEQADEYHEAAERYLADGKKLIRKSWWTFW